MRDLRPSAATRWALLVFLLLGLLASGIAWRVDRSYRQAEQQRFEEHVQALHREVEKRFGLYEYGLRGARGALIGIGLDSLKRERFRDYMTSRDLVREFPGARGFGFIRRVPRAQQAAYLAAARADGAPDFSLRQLSAHEGEHFVIEFVYPEEPNRGATGLDIASEANRRTAALRALQTGAPALTGPVTLVQAGSAPRRGFLQLLAVYRPGAPLASAAERDAACIGWVYAPLLVDEVLAGLTEVFREVRIEIRDGADATPFYRSAQAGADALQHASQLQLFGREWQLQVQALPRLAQALGPNRAAWVAGSGWLIALLAALTVGLALQRHDASRRAAGLDVGSGPVNLGRFLASPLARSVLLLYGLGLALYLGLAWRELGEAQRRDAERRLLEQVEQRTRQVRQSLQVRRISVQFLAQTPPVLGLWRSLGSGVDALESTQRSLWERRMAQIFSAYMSNAPEVLELRVVDMAARPTPLLGVRRVDAQLRTEPGGQLDTEEQRLLSLAARLPAGRSQVAPVRTRQGHVVLQLAAPAQAPDGHGAMVVLITVDLARRAEQLRSQAPADMQVFSTTEDGVFIEHPDEKASLVGNPEAPLSWETAFTQAVSPETGSRLETWTYQGAPHWVVREQVALNDDSSPAAVAFAATLSQDAARQQLRAELLQRALLPLGAGGVGVWLLFLYWAGLQRQLIVRDQRLQLAALLDQAGDAFVALDGEGRVRSWNRSAEQLSGYAESAASGRTLGELLPADPPWPAGLEPARYDTQVRLPDGEARWFTVDWRPLAEGTGAAVSVSLHDISEARAAQQRMQQLNVELERQVRTRTGDLARERERLANIIDGTDVGTWEWQVQSGEKRLNVRWAAIVGLRLGDVPDSPGSPWQALVHPEDRALLDEDLRRHLRGETPDLSCELRLRHRNGRWIWVLVRGRLFSWSPDGRPEWMFGTQQDISVMKAVQAQLRESAALLRGVLQAATEVSIIATDTEGLIKVFNSGAERLLGWRADELIDKQSPALLHVGEEVMARSAELTAEYGEPIEGFRVFVHVPELKGAEQREWTYRRKDGSELPVALVVTAQRDATGQVIGYLGMAQDITLRRQVEAALRSAKEAAEAASQAKSSFLANMSHEIRTPMNAVLGIAHLLKDAPLPPDQLQLVGKLEGAGRNLLAIINDVLDLAKIEAGALSIEWSALEPRRLLAEVQELLGDQASSKGLQLELQCEEAVPPVVEGDALRLRQVLVNLVGNAIKFTAQGRIELGVQRKGEQLHWSVSDTGIGIAPAALASLFTPFQQADVSTTRRFGGTGLGLSIVRELTALMGGEVEVQSEPGVGSRFQVSLPLRTLSQPAPRNDVLHVLLLSPQPDAALEALCRRLGWELSVAAKLPDDGRRWDLLLLDARQDVQVAAQLDALALRATACVLLLDAHSPAPAGAPPPLRDPIDASRLFNAANTALLAQGAVERLLRGTQLQASGVDWLHGLRLLVVDDAELNVEVASRLLRREGAEVDTAADGAQALQRLREQPQRYDAVLMDVQMPGMDGLEATRRLRDELGLRALPVLALTAGALQVERDRALAAGMNDFLTKPLEPEALVRALRLHVERARALPVQARALAAQAPAGWPAIEGISSVSAARHFSGDQALWRHSLQRFVREYAAEGTDWPLQLEADALSARLHRLRGSAGLLGAEALMREAAALEQRLRAGEPGATTALRAPLQAFASALQRLAEAVEAALPAAPEPAPPPITAELRPDPATLQQLRELLRSHDLAAGDMLGPLLPSLRAVLGAPLTQRIQDAVNDLDFELALQCLAAIGPQAPSSDD